MHFAPCVNQCLKSIYSDFSATVSFVCLLGTVSVMWACYACFEPCNSAVLMHSSLYTADIFMVFAFKLKTFGRQELDDRVFCFFRVCLKCSHRPGMHYSWLAAYWWWYCLLTELLSLVLTDATTKGFLYFLMDNWVTFIWFILTHIYIYIYI